MTAALIIVLGLVAWTLGPVMLRCAGTLLLVTVLVVWTIPTASQTSAATLVGIALSGALLRCVGTVWGARRGAPGLHNHGARR
jgi:hypothetical protein